MNLKLKAVDVDSVAEVLLNNGFRVCKWNQFEKKFPNGSRIHVVLEKKKAERISLTLDIHRDIGPIRGFHRVVVDDLEIARLHDKLEREICWWKHGSKRD